MEEQYTKYIILALMWIAYLVLHSAMISITVTEFLKRKLGNYYRFYRLFYTIVAAGTLIPLLYYSIEVKEPMFFTWDGYLFYVKWFIRILGILLCIAGLWRYSLLSFLGVRQILDGSRHNLMNVSGKLDVTGIHGLIRHPWYSAAIMLFWARELDETRLIINTIITVYVIIGTLLEDRKLILEFGATYEEYRQKVSMFVPWKYVKNKLFA